MIKPFIQIFCLASATSSTAISLVVPDTLETTDGNSFRGVPFSVFPENTARYQQVYQASQFAVFGSEGAWITDIAFRTDISAPGFAATLPNIRIDLSTTTQAPDGMSTIFNENLGADNMTVFSGSVSLSGGPGLWQFIELRTPFHYRPSRGNLLVDVKNFQGLASVAFDGVLTEGDSVSSLVNNTDVFSAVGTASTFGFATVFEYTPVPEPGAISVIAIGMCGLGLLQWGRKQKGS